jgi:flagellar basal-body rod protein FlgB
VFERPEILRLAGALAAHTADRQSVVARNVANADTPGYRSKDLEDFAAIYRAGSDMTLRQSRSGHQSGHHAGDGVAGAVARTVDAGGQASPNGNTVSLETEMIRAVEVKRGHDIALAVYRNSLDMLRAALGRGR